MTCLCHRRYKTDKSEQTNFMSVSVFQSLFVCHDIYFSDLSLKISLALFSFVYNFVWFFDHQSLPVWFIRPDSYYLYNCFWLCICICVFLLIYTCLILCSCLIFLKLWNCSRWDSPKTSRLDGTIHPALDVSKDVIGLIGCIDHSIGTIATSTCAGLTSVNSRENGFFF